MHGRTCSEAVFVALLTLSVVCTTGGSALTITAKGTGPCEIQTRGESEHNVTRLQMLREEEESKYGSNGIFIIQEPVDFGLTIVKVNASGYCTVNQRTEQPFHLLLAIYEGQRRVEVEEVPAECDSSTNDTETILCHVQLDTNRFVPANRSIGILFNHRCSARVNRCSCRPATQDTGTEQYTYSNISSMKDSTSLDNFDFVGNVGLQISFTVMTDGCSTESPGSDSQSNDDNVTLLAAVIAGLSAVMLYLLLAISAAQFYRSRKKKQTSLVGHCTTQELANIESGDVDQVSVSTPTKQKKTNRRRKEDHIFEGELATTRPLPELPPSPSPPPPVNLVHQLQKELVLKNMLYLKHQLHLSKVIGEGESGLVYRGYINGNELVAVKTGKALLSGSNKERLLKEVPLMLSFDHPNVMSLIGICFDGEVPLLIMPFMSGGSVLNYVTQNRDNLHFTDDSLENEVSNARKKCLGMCHQIANGMSYLAMKRFIHRDLAARNCMVDMTGNGVIKVADFGLAEDVYTRNYYHHSRSEGGERVPIRWMAPESIDTNIYNETTDVWSFGVTCWEVFTCGRVPYTGLPAMTLLSELHSGHRLERPSNVACSDQIWKTIGLCWLTDPQQRSKFNDLTSKLFNILDSDSSYFRL